MGHRIAGAVTTAGLLAAITTGCAAKGTGTLTVSPGPATTTAASTGTGETNTQDGAPVPTGAPAPAGAPDPGSQSSGTDAGIGDATGTPAPPPAPGPVAECTDGQIHIRAEDISGVNPNYNGTRLIFETTGTTSCWLRGYPAVTMWAPGDTWVHASRALNSAVYGQNPDHSWNDPQQITIDPGQPAHAIVENTVTDNGRPCPVSHTLNVTPPDLTATQPVETAAIHPCMVVVHPITP